MEFFFIDLYKKEYINIKNKQTDSLRMKMKTFNVYIRNKN